MAAHPSTEHRAADGADAPPPTRGVQVRQLNLARVLELLHVEGPTSRAQLTQRTGLNRSTIGGLVRELTDLGLATERGVATTPGPGRPSPIVHAAPRGALTLAIEITVDSLATAVIGLGGEILAERRLVRPRTTVDPTQAVAAITEQVATLSRTWSTAPVVGVGVAIAGLTNRPTGFVDLGPNLGWRDVPLADLLREALTPLGLDPALPILLANEADLGALAEHRRGAGTRVEHLVYVSGEVGIGVGVISGGRPLLGAAGYAAEAGHMLVNPRGRRCGCGARGCWETEAGERALLRRAEAEPALVGRDAIEAVLRRAADGDPVARDAIDETGWWLGVGFGALVNLYNPEAIVLGGLYHRLLEPAREAIQRGFEEHGLHVTRRGVSLAGSELGDTSLLVGASELAFTDLLTDPVGALQLATAR
jgi:predicted NBD/HSP70 family sugar kinase